MYKQLFEHNITASAVINSDGNIAYSNGAFIDLFGDSYVNHKFEDLICDDHEKLDYRQSLQDYMSDDKSNVGGKIYIKAKRPEGGCFNALVNTFIFDHETNKGVGVYVIDISDDVDRENELREKNEELNVMAEELRANNEDLKNKERLLQEGNVKLESYNNDLAAELKKEKEFKQKQKVITILAWCFFMVLGFIMLETLMQYAVDAFGNLSKDLVNSSNNRSNLLINLLVGIVGYFGAQQADKIKNKSI